MEQIPGCAELWNSRFTRGKLFTTPTQFTGPRPRDVIATTQAYCDHPHVWLNARFWEKREERADRIPATAAGGRRGSSLVSSSGRSEASVERKGSLSLGVRAPSYLTVVVRSIDTGKALIYGKGRQERQSETLAQQRETKDFGGIHFT